MKKTWLILDGNFLSWRTFHTTGRLANGVLFGFLKDVQHLAEQMASPHLVFCFDHGESRRKKLLPAYKAKRHSKELSEEEKEQIAEMRQQIGLLKSSVLKECGFKNVFYHDGFEADDLIAECVKYNLPESDEAIIVSADHDLYQLLTDRVSIWNPTRKEMTTESKFRDEYGIEPFQWVSVKAMAGCSSDEIPGIKGVGEKTAAKYLAGKLKPESAAYKLIHSGDEVARRNTDLVKLPMEGTPDLPPLDPGIVDQRGWNKVAERFGLRSLKGKPAGARGTGFGIRPKV